MRHGYAGPVYSSTQRALWPWYVPQLRVRDLACDMPDSTCSNDKRINDQKRLVAPSTASLLLNPGVNGPTGEHDLRITTVIPHLGQVLSRAPLLGVAMMRLCVGC